MFDIHANHRCVKCNAPFEPVEHEATYMVQSASERRCPKCRQKYSAQLMKDALSYNVERLCTLVDNRKDRVSNS